MTNKALIDYLTERRINLDIAKEHCKEIYYSIGDKRYFAIGFENESGRYELRNKYFKGCTSKDITTYKHQLSNQQEKQNTEVCLVFEGFIDFLSYLTIKDRIKPLVDTIVLNSTANLSKAMELIKAHDKVYTFLDNDSTGRNATEQIAKTCPAVIDQSVKYAGCNDLNDYLCKHNLKKKEAEPIKQKGVITQPKRSRRL